jgi:hypothetical protein
MLRDVLVASAILAVIVTTIAGLLGHLSLGVGVACGLLLGSANGYAIAALIGRSSSFVAGSMLRLVTLTALGLIVTVMFSVAVWPVMLGVAAAQLVMVAASVRQGLRA